jgi:hypothetical protein
MARRRSAEIANTATGVSVDGSSAGLPSPPDVTTTLFQNNTTNLAGISASNTINAPAGAPLFVDPSEGNFYLAASQPGNPNQAIDSSLNTRVARTEYTSVTTVLGIPPDYNPNDGVIPGQDMFAPEIDRYGQKRLDDSRTPNASGLGANIFIDRGAIERADFLGPVARMVSPLDNDPAGVDLDTATTYIHIDPPAGSPPITQFIVEIRDSGIGVDDRLAGDSANYVLTRDGRILVDGQDYLFAYNANTNQAIFTSASTFPLDSLYEITLDNSAGGIMDLAGNVLAPNRTNGQAAFTILLGGHNQDYGDAPNSYLTTKAVDGPRHVIFPSINLYLGAGVDADPDGRPSAGATGDDAD